MKDTPPSPSPGSQGHYGPIPSYPGYGYPGTASSSRFPRFLRFAKRLWWIPFLTLAVALCAAAVYIFLQPPAFLSAARLWVSGKLSMKENALFSEELQFFFGTQVELLESDRLQLAAQNRVQALDPTLAPCPIKLRATQLPKSSIFQLIATGENAAYTQAYLNALIDEYLNYRKLVRTGTADGTMSSVSDKVFQYEKELNAQQLKLDAYQRSNNVAAVLDDATSASATISRLNAQLSDLQLEDQMAQSSFSPPTNAMGGTTAPLGPGDPRQINPGSSSAVAPSPDVTAARMQLQFLKLQRDELAQFLRPKHPKMQRLADDIARQEKLIAMYLQQSRDDLEPAHQTRLARMDTIRSAIKEWEGKLLQANAKLSEFNDLQTNVVRSQAIFDKFSGMLQAIDVNKDLDQEVVSVMQRASAPVPDKPSLPRTIILACVAGLGVGFLMILGVARMDDRLTSMSELMEQFDEEIVGQVPNVPRGQRNGKLGLIEPDDPRHMFAESYRNIRSSVFFMPAEDQRPRLLLITSSVPNEGKSTISANLARTMAFAGARVLLVDGDLRKGRLHEYFGVERGAGLSKFLRDPKAELDDYMVQTPLPNLWLIPSGDPVSDASERFLSTKFEQLIAEAQSRFDQVIFDSAPVFAADDAPTMAPRMDGVLFVLRGGFTRARMAREALDILYQRQSKVLGLIYNRADVKSGNYYYYKYADYYNAGSKGAKGKRA